MATESLAGKLYTVEKTTTQTATPKQSTGQTLLKIALILTVLYVFLTSIGLMGAGFKVFGKDFAKTLIQTTANPFVGLFIGIFATALIQSSSTTTSMVVAFVASGTLTVQGAIPVIMGANIGTAVTSTVVSLGHITRKSEFKRAFAAGTAHDLFNLMTVAVFLPLEMLTGYLSRSAYFLTTWLAGSAGLEFKSPLKMITKPVTVALVDGIGALSLSKLATGIFVVVLGTALLITSLVFLARLLRSLVLHRLQGFFEKSLGRSGMVAIAVGLVITMLVQSSSVTTSLMIPMAAAGVMTLRQVFPVALGANLGTTITALLASLATGRPEALTIALVHVLFNVSGILVFYPLGFMRNLPLIAARGLSVVVARRRVFAIVFIGVFYFAIPGLSILLT